MTTVEQELLGKLYARSCRMQDANFATATRYKRLWWITGYPGAILAAITTVPVFATFFDSDTLWLKIAAIITSFLGGTAAATNVFFDFKQTYKMYQETGKQYSILKGKVEMLLTYPRANMQEEIEKLKERWDGLQVESIPDDIWSEFSEKKYTFANGGST